MDIPPPPPPIPPPPGAYGVPPPPPPPFPGPGYAGAPPSPVKRHGLAIAALVLGIVGIPLCFLFVPPLLALIFGLVAARSIKRAGHRHASGTGFGMARAGWILGLIGLLLFAAFVVADATGAFDDDTVAVTELRVGACVNVSDIEESDIVRELPSVECSELHDAEVFDVDDLPAGSFPGADEVDADVEDRCVEAFAPYVGVEYGSSEFGIIYLTPPELSWKIDRSYICIATAPDQVTGTIEGSQR